MATEVSSSSLAAPAPSVEKSSSPAPISPKSNCPAPIPTATPPALPPLITNTNTARRTTTAPRPPSYANKRMSSYQGKNPSQSRPSSHVFPVFHSSLPYTLVRDFAYPTNHPYHYGPPPNNSGLSTPASDTRRLSDPPVSSRDDLRGQRPSMAPWTTESMTSNAQSNSREQLPAMTFTDGGPPYSEDEDLHSPVVTTSRHKKNRSSTNDRGRSPGSSSGSRGVFVGVNGDGSEAYYINDKSQADEDTDGPGGEIVSYPPDRPRQSLLSPEFHRSGRQRDSHFATSIRRPSESDARPRTNESDDDYSETEEEARFSRNYSFTIASPDEEMHGKAVALFDFESEHENELPLTEGQIVLISYRHGQGWLVAQDPKTGESGLVPEEFVRLVRDIEGGLNGLTAQIDELLSPGSDHAATPTVSAGGFGGHEKKASNGSNMATGEKHPSMQSTFSTSSKDLERYPLQKDKDDTSTPTLPGHPLRNELVDAPKEKGGQQQMTMAKTGELGLR